MSTLRADSLSAIYHVFNTLSTKCMIAFIYDRINIPYAANFTLEFFLKYE